MKKTDDGVFTEAEKNTADIDYFSLSREFDLVKPGQEVERRVQLDLLYELNKPGRYKVRAILLNRLTHCEEIVTSWQEFEIK